MSLTVLTEETLLYSLLLMTLLLLYDCSVPSEVVEEIVDDDIVSDEPATGVQQLANMYIHGTNG